MSGGNFFKLKLYPGNILFPAGPLVVEQGETIKKIFVWIYQLNHDASGASLATANIGSFPSRAVWSAPTSPGNYDGTFQPGQINCSAMAVSEKNGKTQLYWWAETMMMEAAAPGEAVPATAEEAEAAYETGEYSAS